MAAPLVFVGIMLGGCSSDGGDGTSAWQPEAPVIEQDGITVYFPRQSQDSEEFMEADHSGELILDDQGCLRMRPSDITAAPIVIWPPTGITVDLVDGEVALVKDDTGDLIARVGDSIMLGGGGPVDDPSNYMDAELPDPCAGDPQRYWISGHSDEIERIEPDE